MKSLSILSLSPISQAASDPSLGYSLLGHMQHTTYIFQSSLTFLHMETTECTVFCTSEIFPYQCILFLERHNISLFQILCFYKPYCVLAHICGIWKNWYRRSYLQSRNRDTDVENKHIDTKGKKGDGMNWEIGIEYIYITDTVYKIGRASLVAQLVKNLPAV